MTLDVRWTRERASRAQRVRLVQCAVAAAACAVVTVAVPWWWLEASIVALASGILTWGYLRFAREAWRDLRQVDDGEVQLDAATVGGVRILAAVSQPHALTLELAGGGRSRIPVPRRHQRSVIQHLEAHGIHVRRDQGELVLLVLTPVLLVGVVAFVGAQAVVEALVTVGVLWVGSEAPAVIVVLALLAPAVVIGTLVRRRRALSDAPPR